MRMRRGNARLLRDCPAAGMRRRKCASRMSLPNFFKALFTGIGVSNLTLLSIIKIKYPFFYKKWNNYFLFYAKSILSFSRFFQLSEQQEIERFVRTAEEFEDSLPTG